MRFAKPLALLAVVCWMASMAPLAEAAKKKRPAAAGAETVSGTVLHHHGKKPVAGAHVHFAAAHHARHAKHSRSTKTLSTTQASKHVKVSKTLAAKRAARVAIAQAKVRRAGAQAHGTLTNANGQFSLTAQHAGTHVVVAHKKHVGSGHARVTLAAGQTASVTIRLHKHHHHHSGAVAAAANGKPAKA